MNIPISQIDLPPDLLRDNDPDVSDLLPTVGDPQIGILQPLLVRPGSVAGRYELIAGKRRLTAARAVGLTEVPAEVRDLTPQLARIAELVENLARRDLPAHREAEGIVELIRLRFEQGGMEVPSEEVRRILWRLSNEQRGQVEARLSAGVEGETVRAVFEQLGRSFAAFVTGTLPAMSWPEDVRGAMERGLSKAAGQQLAQIKDPTLRAEATRRVEGGERAKSVKAELLADAGAHRRLERDLGDGERLAAWPRDAAGWFVPDLTLDHPEPSGMDVVPRDALLVEVLARLGHAPGAPVVLVDLPLADALAALAAGYRVWTAAAAARFDGEFTETPPIGGDEVIIVGHLTERGVEYGLTDVSTSTEIWAWARAQDACAALILPARDLGSHLSDNLISSVLIGVAPTPSGGNSGTLALMVG